jgi:hypothetical protein
MDEVKIIDSSQTQSQLNHLKQQVSTEHCLALPVSTSIHHRDLLPGIVLLNRTLSRV